MVMDAFENIKSQAMHEPQHRDEAETPPLARRGRRKCLDLGVMEMWDLMTFPHAGGEAPPSFLRDVERNEFVTAGGSWGS